MVLWAIIMVSLSRGPQNCQWRGLVCVWLQRIGTGALVQVSSVLEGINDHPKDKDETVGDKVCVESALCLSVNRSCDDWQAESAEYSNAELLI